MSNSKFPAKHLSASVQLPDKQQFFEQVWSLVRQIPQGKVATYGQLTKLLDQPEGVSEADYKMSAARWVGSAMAACPDNVPWHRVINSQGKISHSREAAQQKQLLEAENVFFTQDKINLDVYQWRAPGEPEKPRQELLF